MEYLGAWGTLIHEKNLKSKISYQTPFNDDICWLLYKYKLYLFYVYFMHTWPLVI